jgi:hypothetical protein
MNKDQWLRDFADLLINLSAGWFGAAFIVSAFAESFGNIDIKRWFWYIVFVGCSYA